MSRVDAIAGTWVPRSSARLVGDAKSTKHLVDVRLQRRAGRCFGARKLQHAVQAALEAGLDDLLLRLSTEEERAADDGANERQPDSVTHRYGDELSELVSKDPQILLHRGS